MLLLGLSLASSPALATPPPPATEAPAPTALDVSFPVGDRSVPGTLLVPAGPGPRPAVLLLAGSGPTDRDWNSPGLPGRNGAGRELARRLADAGYVVLRFDKAGSGANPGPPLAASSFDTWRDEALAALDLLRARPEVRADRLFVAGHSEGGLHATRVALARPEGLAGVLYLASASRSMAETMTAQLEAQLTHPAAGLPPERAAAEVSSIRAALADLIAGRPVDPTRASTLPPVQALIAQLAATPAISGPLLAFDNAAEAPRIGVPALVLGGARDVQIDPDLDTRRLAHALTGAGLPVTLHLAPDADHLLRRETRSVEALRADLVGVQTRYNADDRVLDEGALRVLLEWLGRTAG